MTPAVPEEFNGVTPHLVVDDPMAAAAFYEAAFGADRYRTADAPDGRVWHVELYLAGGRLLLMPPYPQMGTAAPGGDTSVMLHIYVPDADAVHARAVSAGASSLMEPHDSFWGDRYCQVRDPFGHRWAIASQLEDLGIDEGEARGEQFKREHPDAPLS